MSFKVETLAELTVIHDALVMMVDSENYTDE